MARHQHQDGSWGRAQSCLAQPLQVPHDIKGAALMDQPCVEGGQQVGHQQEGACQPPPSSQLAKALTCTEKGPVKG